MPRNTIISHPFKLFDIIITKKYRFVNSNESRGVTERKKAFHWETSHKEVSQFYSPAASDIASSDIRLTPSGIRALTM